MCDTRPTGDRPPLRIFYMSWLIIGQTCLLARTVLNTESLHGWLMFRHFLLISMRSGASHASMSRLLWKLLVSLRLVLMEFLFAHGRPWVKQACMSCTTPPCSCREATRSNICLMISIRHFCVACRRELRAIRRAERRANKHRQNITTIQRSQTHQRNQKQ